MLTFFYFWAVKQLFGTCNQILKKGNGQLRKKKKSFFLFRFTHSVFLFLFIFASPSIDIKRNNLCCDVTLQPGDRRTRIRTDKSRHIVLLNSWIRLLYLTAILVFMPYTSTRLTRYTQNNV